MSALLTFSLGPVQPFIAQARKTSDLWIGSYLLSSLMRAALQDYPHDQLLFPVLNVNLNVNAGGANETDDTASSSRAHAKAIADVPNKFVARHSSVDEALDRAKKVCERIEQRWRLLAEAVWRHVFGADERDPTLTAIWRRQTDPATLFEMYWAIIPEDENLNTSADASGLSTSYGVMYQRTQAMLDARKRLRSFAAADEPGEKSTISGEREALHRTPPAPQTAVTAKDVQEFWEYLSRRFPKSQLGRAGRERLDAVDLIKRFATTTSIVDTTVSFPSTHSLAAGSFFFDVIQHLQQSQSSPPAQLHAAITTLAKCADDSGYSATPEALPALHALAGSGPAKSLLQCDGHALHIESYTPANLRDSVQDETQIGDLAKRGPEAVYELRKHARQAGIAPPSSYYAVLLLDGDHMGKLLTGLTSPDDHRNFSETLSRFAHTHPSKIIEGVGLGRVVYAGGDDVLAFLPTRQVLRAAQDLRVAYGEALNAFARNGQPVTASAGIVIAHRRAPLRLVLAEARAAEHAAKEQYGRDAIVVSLMRRSGAITRVGAHWSYPLVDSPSPSPSPVAPASSTPAPPPPKIDLVASVLAVSDRLHEHDLSPRFVYALLEEAPTIGALDSAARRAEIKRLLLRQRQPSRVEHFGDTAIEKLADDLAALAAAFDRALPAKLAPEEGYDLAKEGSRRGMVELAGWLLIAAFLAREEDEE